jgi:competence protein ComEA
MRVSKSLITILIGFLLGVFVSGLVFLTLNKARFLNNGMMAFPKNTPTSALEEPALASTLMNDSKININIASESELVNLPGIGSEKAARIIEFRTKYGSFQEIDELLYVPGVGVNLFNSIQSLITIVDN